MFICNCLFLCHHNFVVVQSNSSPMVLPQFLIVQKLNQNIMMGCLLFNLKQIYQTTFVYPLSFLLSRAYLEHNILQIIIITLLCKNENIPNFIILLNLDPFSSKISNHLLSNYFLVALPIWNSNLFQNFLLCKLFLLIVFLNVVANHFIPAPF